MTFELWGAFNWLAALEDSEQATCGVQDRLLYSSSRALRSCARHCVGASVSLRANEKGFGWLYQRYNQARPMNYGRPRNGDKSSYHCPKSDKPCKPAVRWTRKLPAPHNLMVTIIETLSCESCELSVENNIHLNHGSIHESRKQSIVTITRRPPSHHPRLAAASSSSQASLVLLRIQRLPSS
jgi:hypothetical protein